MPRLIQLEELPPERRPGPVVDKIGMTLGELVATGQPGFLVMPVPRTQKLYRPAGITPALPVLAGVALQPRPPLELRTQMVAARMEALIMDEACAITILISAIRRHKEGYFWSPPSRDFSFWLRHAYDLGADVVPLLYHQRVQPEVIKTFNLINNSTSNRKEAA